MGLHPAFFLITVIGWLFAALGVVYEDVTVRDAGVLVALAAMAVGLLMESETLRTWRASRAGRTSIHVATRKEPAVEVPPAPVAAAPGEVVRPPIGKVSHAWEGEFVVASATPAAPEPIAVAPRAVAVHAPSSLAVTPPAANGDRLTRGVCSKCQSPITVSSRRPIRVTCPMCGHSKVLQ